MAVDQSGFVGALDAARSKIADTIRSAASATGASFEYLVSAAKLESNFDTSSQASTSSARGLFQFIEQTWLGTVKEAGAALGFGTYAAAIDKSSSGSYSVSDPAMRKAILDLRDDPAVNSAMAGVLTQSNSFKLTANLGRKPTDAELYMAHFMGVSGASRLITAAQDTPNANGAQMFAPAASANRSIFYNRDGSARTVSQVYSELSARYDNAANSQSTRTALASAGAARGTSARNVVAAIDNAAYLSTFPDARTPELHPVSATSSQTKVSPIFRSLFQSGDRAEPVSSTVRELWGNGASLTSTTPASANDTRTPQPLDLFSDRNGIYSG
jgi:hypothetical protein